MAKETTNQEGYQEYQSDTNIKLRDLEEKQNIVRDRVILLGENFLDEKEELLKEVENLKLSVKNLKSEMNKIKLAIQRISDNFENYSKKSDVDTLKSQADMFQPLELARLKDVEDLIKKYIKEKA